MERVADWQLANPSKHWPDDWTQGAGYAGIMALADLSQDAKYRDAMVAMGEKNQWRLGKRKFHADDHTVGQTYVELYLATRDARMIAPMRAQFDDILAHPSDAPSLDFRLPKHKSQELWSWCDALFMSPPAWLRLAKATGDQRYRDFAVTSGGARPIISTTPMSICISATAPISTSARRMAGRFSGVAATAG
jgi:unsaturated rhamnogalacturonyl hydrolase